MNQRADIMWSVGANTRQFDRAIENSRTKADRALNSLGTSIERKTMGVRKFAGSLGATAAVVSGIIGPASLLLGAVTGIAVGWERARNAARESAEMVARNRSETQALLRELRADRGAGSTLGEQIENTVNPLRDRAKALREKASQLRGRAIMAEEFGVIGNLGTAIGIPTDPVGNRSKAAELESQASQVDQEANAQTRALISQYRRSVNDRLREVDAARQLSAAQRDGLTFEVQRLQARKQAEQEITELVKLRDKVIEDGQLDLVRQVEGRIAMVRRGLREDLSGIDE
ncbi:MAG: hypothetical protein NXI14_08920, partial [bacterium]|nr:hypothetical protein [bacterium]